MIGFGNTRECEECPEWLTGRQTRFCSRACQMRSRRRNAPPPAEKVCRLCGANFRPRRGKQTYCDYDEGASAECAELQNAEHEAQFDARNAREDDLWCAQCGEWMEWSGRGRPPKFCAPQSL